MKSYLNTNWNYDDEELVEVFDELPLWAAPFGLKLLDGIRYRKGIKAVDIGFGAGFPLTELAMRLGKTATVYGVDPWERAVDRAEKKIKHFGITNVEIIRGVAENIPLKSNTIDLVVSNNGLNNVFDLSKALSECRRILKPSGQFVQTVNLNNTMLEFYSAMEKILTELELPVCLDLMKEQIYKKRKPLEQYLETLKKHGFEANEVLHDAFDYKFVDGTTMLNHHFFRLAFLDSWKSIVPPDRQDEIFSLIEDELNLRAQHNGLLKLSVPFVLIDCTLV